MTDTVIGMNAEVDCAILDKRVQLGAGAKVGWGDDWASDNRDRPSNGITVVGKNTSIPARTRIGRNCAIAADLSEGDLGQDLIPSGTTVGVSGE
jgi:glucose-1-phosphate adenylyltransferase